jgi:hypothetical protein
VRGSGGQSAAAGQRRFASVDRAKERSIDMPKRGGRGRDAGDGGRGSGLGLGGGKGRGGGQGRGAGVCVCPQCGRTAAHRLGIPCMDEKCPECNIRMIRKD